jgi:hypothetical protein
LIAPLELSAAKGDSPAIMQPTDTRDVDHSAPELPPICLSSVSSLPKQDPDPVSHSAIDERGRSGGAQI